MIAAERAAPRVLFVAPVEPWCRENGSSVIIADLLEGLSGTGGAEIFPVFLRRPPPGCKGRAPEGLEGVQLGLEGVPRWYSILKAVALRSTPLRMRFANAKAARLLLHTVRERGFVPTVVHVEHLPLVDMGLTVARTFGCPLVYRAHNVEAQLLERRLMFGGPMARALLRYMSRTEAEASELSQLTLCISELNLEWVRTHAPTAEAQLFPCSLLLDRYDSVSRERSKEPQIGFVGGLDWAPNDAGLRWFVDHVLPRVLAGSPGARLAVLARGASDRAWLTSNPAIRILDGMSDARTLFASSWVSIAPLLQGGGVRIKIPESLALGCPVVATHVGAEGHELPGLTRTDDPDEFARACIRHLAGPDDATHRELRAAVEARYGANVLAKRLVEHWTALSGNERHPAP